MPGFRFRRAQTLSERSLRRQFHFEFAGQVLPGELLVLTDVRRRHSSDTAGAQQDSETVIVDAAVVGEHLEVGCTRSCDRVDQHVGDAAQAESADGQRCAVDDVATASAADSYTFAVMFSPCQAFIE